MPAIMALAMVGWRFLTMLVPSAQLAQWAATLVCTALVNPSPSMDNGRCKTFADAGGDCSKISLRQYHTWASCIWANACVSSGRTMRNQMLALVAHINSKSQHNSACSLNKFQVANLDAFFFFETDEDERTSEQFSPTTISQKACKRAFHLVKRWRDQPLEAQEVQGSSAPLLEPQCRTEESPIKDACSALPSQQPDLALGLHSHQQTHESLGFSRPTPTDFDT